ncbi:MAG TPA: FtsX-like permease family protein [Spirochaetota bacterium]|nr:FtsX-like permease family protein [Spirochaetota bacterium]HOL57909.1 FtsX-like permease family protein [Spirochaetota bacterium]HPP04771.1 FtsX-like permease family protein [Spirochaetota bacterium]
MKLLNLAFKNLSRHKTKTIITSTAIAIGVWLYIFIDAWLSGIQIDSKRNLINFEIGSVKIYKKEYFEKKDEIPMYESFKNYEKIIERLDKEGYNASPRIKFTGSLLSKEIELPFLFIGVNPELEKRVFKTHEFIEKGTFVEDNLFGIVLGIKGAKDLGVDIGDTVKLSTVIDKKDENNKIKHIYQVMELRVIGIINSTNSIINGKIAYLPLSILQDEMGLMLEGHITEICIRKKDANFTELPKNSEKAKFIENKIKDLLPGDLILVDWDKDAKDYISVSSGDAILSYITIALLLTLAVIGIANTMLMAVTERTKEIGMLKALGTKDSEISLLYFMEAGLIGFIGAFAGIILGIITNLYMVNIGIDYTEFFEKSNMENIGYRVIGIFKSIWNWDKIVLSGIFSTLIASLTAYFPVKRALKINIVDALRFE